MKKTVTNLTPLIEINIESKVLLIRGKNVILEKDLAELYGVTTGNLNKAVKRNIERFPEDTIFRISKDEYDSLGPQSGILKKSQRSKYLPQAFTQEGIDILPGILNSKRSIEANVQILGTFNRRREMLLRYKDEYYRHTFEIACNKMGDLNELDMDIFSNVMQLLGDNITDQIENFMACNKGILLVGGDYDLLSGAAGYIWYTHPLQYFVSGNECVGDEDGRALLQHKDFCGHSEEEIKMSLFSQPDGLMNKYKAGTVLFLRDIKMGYTDVLERLARVIRGFKPRRVGGGSVWDEYQENIVIIHAKQTEGLPEDLLQNFEVIELEPGAKGITLSDSKEIVNATVPDNKKTLDTLKLKLVVDEGGVYWRGSPLFTIKGKDFNILHKLARTPGYPVNNDELTKFIDSHSHKGKLLNQRISKIRKSFPSPYNDIKDPLCIIPDGKRNKGYYCLNLTKDQVEIS